MNPFVTGGLERPPNKLRFASVTMAEVVSAAPAPSGVAASRHITVPISTTRRLSQIPTTHRGARASPDEWPSHPRHTYVQVDFGDIHDQNLEQLRKLNLGTFPVRYNAKFYSNILNTPKEFTQVCCRVGG